MRWCIVMFCLYVTCKIKHNILIVILGKCQGGTFFRNRSLSILTVQILFKTAPTVLYSTMMRQSSVLAAIGESPYFYEMPHTLLYKQWKGKYVAIYVQYYLYSNFYKIIHFFTLLCFLIWVHKRLELSNVFPFISPLLTWRLNPNIIASVALFRGKKRA